MSNSFDPYNPGNEAYPQESGSGKGCLWGCLIGGGLVVASILCAGIGGYWFVSSQIAKYTSEQPVILPTVDYSEEQFAELDSRVKSFQEKLDSGEAPDEDLELSADDINAMIGKNEDLKGRVYVKIENDQVEGDVSIPIDKLPGGKGRYLNGSASFDVSMEGGVLIVTVDQAEVNGEPVPEQFMQGLRKENLAKDLYKNPENAKFMRHFEDIRIDDDRFILRVKRGDSSVGAEGGVAEEQPGAESLPIESSDAETGTEQRDPAEVN
jgi:hypothetical protein